MIYDQSYPLMMSVVALLLLLMTNHANSSHKENSPSCPFRLSCIHNKKMLHLSTPPVPLLVEYIDYYPDSDILVSVSDPANCLPRLVLTLNFSSIYPFQLTSGFRNSTFFDCSSLGLHNLRNSYEGQDLLTCPYVVGSYDGILMMNALGCHKLSDHFWPVAEYESQENMLSLKLSKQKIPSHCFDCNEHKSRKIPILVATGTIVGSAVLTLVLLALFQFYRYIRMKGEDQARVETFLKDYEALQPTRFSYADIKRITRQFKDKLGEGAHGAVYKGKLSNQILVAVKILNNTEGDGKEFINEVGTMGKIHHVNVVRLLGFCADGCRRALVYDFFPNGSLQNFICSPDKDTFLGWDKLQQIALCIAKGIEYLHQGCDQRILHFDINPHNVLLDDNFLPKISDFGLAKLCSKNRSTVSMTAARGTLGYMAPEVFSRNFGNVSYKSDIYSYGMLLLEMVGGRKNINTGQDTFQLLYPDWIHSLLEGGDINIPIDEEANFRIAKKLAIAGLWCIQWHPMHRPSMKTVMQMLEGEVDNFKVPRNPFKSTASTNTGDKVSARRLNLELEVIQE